jgi:hypothetical protein
MIPRWQMAGVIVLVVIAIAAGITGSPNSYAYLVLSGQCNREPMPAACHPRGGQHMILSHP